MVLKLGPSLVMVYGHQGEVAEMIAPSNPFKCHFHVQHRKQVPSYHYSFLPPSGLLNIPLEGEGRKAEAELWPLKLSFSPDIYSAIMSFPVKIPNRFT